MVLPGTLPAEQPPLPPSAPRPKSSAERWTWRIGVAMAVAGSLIVVKLLVSAWGLFSGSHYTFMSMQGDEPVAWNHCHAIPFQVNPKGAPEGWEEIVGQAVDGVEEASGFVFADRGTTVKTQLIGSRYDGNEWEPVLILWSDRYQDGSLAGGVIGRGGPASIEVDGRRRYVIGQVSLDSNVKDPVATRMVLEHELGHVLGLDHTTDPGQLMYPSYHGQHGFGSGDRNGFQRLHDVPCA